MLYRLITYIGVCYIGDPQHITLMQEPLTQIQVPDPCTLLPKSSDHVTLPLIDCSAHPNRVRVRVGVRVRVTM